MVITNPAEQLRGLPGPMEPSYQNRPATTTCRDRTRKGDRKEGRWDWWRRGREEKGDIKQESSSGGQKYLESEIYFNCET